MIRIRILLAIAAVLLSAACAEETRPKAVATLIPFNPGKPDIPALPALDNALISQGEKLYADQCASCHGADLKGQENWMRRNDDGSFRAPPHTSDGHTWHHSDIQLLEAVRLGGSRLEALNIEGTSDMPAFGKILSEEQMIAVLTFIKSNWPEEVRILQWGVSNSPQP